MPQWRSFAILVALLSLVFAAQAQMEPNCNATNHCSPCTSCWGLDCICNNDTIGTIRGSDFVGVLLSRHEVLKKYTVPTIRDGLYVSKWELFVVCSGCSDGIQVQTADTNISSAYAGDLFVDLTLAKPQLVESTPYPESNPPSSDNITIHIVGNPNAFWLWGGRDWFWVLTPTWSNITYVPETPIAPSLPPTMAPVETSPGDIGPPVEAVPQIPPPASPSSSPLPTWAYPVLGLSIVVIVVFFLGYGSYHVYQWCKHRHSASQYFALSSVESGQESIQ